MATKIIMLSADTVFKRFLLEELAKHGQNIDINTHSLADLQRVLRPSDLNILLMDADTVIVPVAQLKNLMDKQIVQVVLLGVKNAAHYLLAGVRGTMSKPAHDSSVFAKKAFVRNVLDRIELFVRNNSVPSAADMGQAANVSEKILAMTASTGGTEALYEVLVGLPARVPPILIVQHMPGGFTNQFAQRLDRSCKFSVKEAAVRDFAKPNLALIAPGDFHMKAVNRGGKLTVECFRGEKLHGVRPAADVLFDSMVEIMGQNVIGVILTGMGSDGAKGLYKLNRKGATIIGQDEASCVVYGMPKAAADLGILNFQLPLNKIAEKISELI